MTELASWLASSISQEISSARESQTEFHELSRLGVQDIEEFVRSGDTSWARPFPSAPEWDPDDSRIGPWEQACVTDSDAVLPLLATELENSWSKEKAYLEKAIEENSAEPAHFYACRAVAQTIHSLSPWLCYVHPGRAQAALAQMIEALEGIVPIADTAGRDREGCIAYYIQGLIWLGEGTVIWDGAAARTLCIRAAHLTIDELTLLENRISMLTRCFWLEHFCSLVPVVSAE